MAKVNRKAIKARSSNNSNNHFHNLLHNNILELRQVIKKCFTKAYRFNVANNAE